MAQPTHSGTTISGFDWQGHRGARGLLPENSLPAFHKALELGVQTLEMDVVISADSQVVVSHETWMNHEICLTPEGSRITEAEEKSHNLYAMPYATIKQFDCGSIGHPRFPQQQAMKTYKPLLHEVIQMAEKYVAQTKRPNIFYNIEIKSEEDGDGVRHPAPPEFAQRLYDVLTQEHVLERTVVQSFDVRALRTMHQMDASVKLAYLIENLDSFEANMAKLDFTPYIYSPSHTFVTPELVQKVHQRNMKLVPWTINTTERMKALIEMGIDGLITDYPNLMFEVK
jgi:glycerophosphoryl diester phosphodiesterase